MGEKAFRSARNSKSTAQRRVWDFPLDCLSVPHFRAFTFRRRLRGVHESVAERNTTTMAESTVARLPYPILGDNDSIPEHCVLLRLIVLEDLCIRQIAPARLDHMSFFSRKCWRARKACPVLSLLLPFQRHTSRAAPEPCVRIELCSSLPGRRSAVPRRCRRLEFWLTCPNF